MPSLPVRRPVRVSPAVGSQYYRSLYRSGTTRRVVTGEHTGMLRRDQREELERCSRRAPHPTLPTSSPPRPRSRWASTSATCRRSCSRRCLATRPRTSSGSVAPGGPPATPSSPRSSGPTPTASTTWPSPRRCSPATFGRPNCFLDAVETLQRQYLAYLLDRIADQTMDGPTLPHQIGALMKTGMDEGGLPPCRGRRVDARSRPRRAVPRPLRRPPGVVDGRSAPHLRRVGDRGHGQGGGRAVAAGAEGARAAPRPARRRPSRSSRSRGSGPRRTRPGWPACGASGPR